MLYGQRLIVRYHHERPPGAEKTEEESESSKTQELFEEFLGESEMMKEPLLLLNPQSGHFEAALTLTFPEDTILNISLEVGKETIEGDEQEIVSVEKEKATSKDGVSHKLQVKVPKEMANKVEESKSKVMTVVVNTE